MSPRGTARPPARAAAPGPPPARARARDLGISIGLLPVGPTNSIVDVAHVRVGHATVWRDEPPPPDGRGVARTGVTVVVPYEAGELFGASVPAGGAVLNGAGEVIGLTSIGEWGILETPIFLTSSMSIGRVYDAAVDALVDADPRMGVDDALMPVVGECDDGDLNTTRRRQIEPEDVRRALGDASGPERGAVPMGVVGAGTGMICFRLKGGIGSASRLVQIGDEDRTVGVLALSNFGAIERLTVAGTGVGRVLADEGWPAAGLEGGHPPPASAVGPIGDRRDRGSCIVVVATDAPLGSHQLERLARRAGLGLARTGSVADHGSGEIFVAFSTGLRVPRDGPPLRTQTTVNDEHLGPLFAAVVEATEEAVLDSLFVADTVVGRDGNAAPGLPVARVLQLVAEGIGR
jgi:D-aminopeptidase